MFKKVALSIVKRYSRKEDGVLFPTGSKTLVNNVHGAEKYSMLFCNVAYIFVPSAEPWPSEYQQRMDRFQRCWRGILTLDVLMAYVQAFLIILCIFFRIETGQDIKMHPTEAHV